MPAASEEIEEAEEEGNKMHFLVAPVRVVGENGKVTGIEVQKMELGEPDASGRRRPVPVKGSEYIIPCDSIVPAIGQGADLGFLPKDQGITLSKWHTVDVDPFTFATGMPGVFAGGDAQTGAATVVEAVHAGKEAAISINRYLSSIDIKEGRVKYWTKGLEDKDITDVTDELGFAATKLHVRIAEKDEAEVRDLPKAPRVHMKHLDPNERRTHFKEVIAGMSEEDAVKEAERCLSCGICSECYQCVDACIAKAINHDDTYEMETVEVGAVIAAPGFETFDAKLRGEYGFGTYANVVTSIQFERILSASGPYFGHVQRLSDGKEPKKVAFIQCVGSRDTNCGNSWCSSVCCMYAPKEAIIGKEHAKNLEPTIFYMDIRAHGKDFDRFVNRAKEEYGIRYIRSMPSVVKELQQSKNLLITYVKEDGSLIEEEFDMVVLSVGLTPPKDAEPLARALGIELEEHGFCRTSIENPVMTSRDGVFVCGAFGGPRTFPRQSWRQAALRPVHQVCLLLREAP
jgi:thioredoxin reductase/ferredoxin